MCNVITLRLKERIFFYLQVFIVVGAIPYAWNVAGNVTAHFGYEAEYEVRLVVVCSRMR